MDKNVVFWVSGICIKKKKKTNLIMSIKMCNWPSQKRSFQAVADAKLAIMFNLLLNFLNLVIVPFYRKKNQDLVVTHGYITHKYKFYGFEF